MFGDLMIYITKHPSFQRLVRLIDVIASDVIPQFNVEVVEHGGSDIFIPFELEEVVALTLEEAVADLVVGWEVLIILIYHVKNTSSIGIVNLCNHVLAPV